MFSKKLFGERVRDERSRAGESQKALGDLLGVSANQIGEMENGRSITTFERLVIICEHYKVTSDYLLGLTDER